MTISDHERRRILTDISIIEDVATYLVEKRQGILSDRELYIAAMTGFDELEAQTVLQHPEALAQLNVIWNFYDEDVLPPTMQASIDEDRRRGGTQWNLLVAHQAGRSWWDDLDDEWARTVQHLGPMSVHEDLLRLARSRGGEVEAAESTTSWEMCLRSEHILILVRRDGQQLELEASSDSKSGWFELTLRWPDGSVEVRQLRLQAGEVTSVLGVPALGGELPASASLRVAPSRG